MQTCYNCGKQVADEVLICPDCGALVKRYTTPPEREEAAPQPQPTYAPRSRLFTDERGKLHFRGGIAAWLIVAFIAAGYFAVSILSSIYISNNESLFIETFAAFDELQPLTKLITELSAAIRAFYGLFVALTVLLSAKFACGIWFVASKKRLAHTILVILTATAAAVLIISGGGMYGWWMLADTLITGLSLRADRKTMR